MQNEAYQCLLEHSLACGRSEINYYGNGENARRIARIIRVGRYHFGDAPDILIQNDDDALIIEHFRFDSYHKRRKGGSPGSREIERIQRREKELFMTNKCTYFHDEIDIESSYEDYLKNVTQGFKKHLLQVPTYHENAKKIKFHNTFVIPKVLFLIEDTTLFGARAIECSGVLDESEYLVTLAQCKPFLDLLIESKGVDYVLACSNDGVHTYNWFIDCQEIESYYKRVLPFENMDFVSFKPQAIYGRF